jgi:hypothetical protein
MQSNYKHLQSFLKNKKIHIHGEMTMEVVELISP